MNVCCPHPDLYIARLDHAGTGIVGRQYRRASRPRREILRMWLHIARSKTQQLVHPSRRLNGYSRDYVQGGRGGKGTAKGGPGHGFHRDNEVMVRFAVKSVTGQVFSAFISGFDDGGCGRRWACEADFDSVSSYKPMVRTRVNRWRSEKRRGAKQSGIPTVNGPLYTVHGIMYRVCTVTVLTYLLCVPYTCGMVSGWKRATGQDTQHNTQRLQSRINK